MPRRALSRVEERALRHVDSKGLTRILRDLVSIRSFDGAEREAQDVVAGEMRRSGLAVDRWTFDVGPMRRHRAFSMEVERDRGVGVVGAIGGTGGRTLILNGHVDVVPPGHLSNWRHPPWRATARGGRVYGRGTADMKGGLACAVVAAKALVESGAILRGRLLLESVIGEEDGGVGTLAAILRGYRGDGAVVAEPTNLGIAPAQAGALCFRILVRGRAAHASVREEGISAIEKFLPVREALARLERRRNRRFRHPLFNRYALPYALSLGRLEAGDWPSTVPERLVVEGRYGVAIDESTPAARREFEEAVARAARADPWLRRHPPKVEWWGGQFEPASVPRTAPIVSTLARAAEDAGGRRPRVAGMTYGSDMRLLVHVAKTPTVLFGPGDVRNAHRPNEFVEIGQLVEAARTLCLAALRFCGAED